MITMETERPKYILGIADAPYLNRLIMEAGADGYIKKKMVHGWELWPRVSWPEVLNVTERTFYEYGFCVRIHHGTCVHSAHPKFNIFPLIMSSEQDWWLKEEEERKQKFIDYLKVPYITRKRQQGVTLSENRI